MIPPLVDGRLPLGRWPATPAETAERFVPSDNKDRVQIWDHWSRLTDALQQLVGHLPAAWLSGSFLTTKDVPADIDCVYVIDTGVLQAACSRGERTAQLLESVASSRMKGFGLRVDSYILEWMPTHGATPTVAARPYRDRRGYWDDLWSRQRSSDAREDAIPRRGYLEVILDGYA